MPVFPDKTAATAEADKLSLQTGRKHIIWQTSEGWEILAPIGTAGITLAGMINAAKLKGTLLEEEREVRSSEELAEFTRYCHEHPTQRFWQALRNWSGHNFIYATDELQENDKLIDTFYWER